jgi:hypothetical protein
MGKIDQRSLEKLPESKRIHILNHQFAFITFKDPENSARVVNEFPYYRQNDKSHNDKLKLLAESARKTKLIENK